MNCVATEVAQENGSSGVPWQQNSPTSMAVSNDSNKGRGTDPSAVLVSHSSTCGGNSSNDLQRFPLGHSRRPATKLDTRWSSVAHGGDEGVGGGWKMEG
ncbi:unnamed protein product [Lactuca virosa]|uniref:Uncharacterized protein n=1 Tax=Lactuca virosa TaxID=75947 RepID=A0AAU9MZK7_9ASTR|nr:unnamed protein product [Lactuca virosa]